LLGDSGEVFCLLLNTFTQLAAGADVYSLLLLSIDQFMRIELSLKYPVYASRRNAYIAVGALLAFVSLNTIPFIVIWTEDNSCSYMESSPLWYQLSSRLTFFVIPLVVIVGMHGRILYLSINQMAQMKRLQISTGGKQFSGKVWCCVIGSRVSSANIRAEGITVDTSAASSDVPRHGVSSQQTLTSPRKHWKATVTLLVLVGTIVLCWTPLNMCMLIINTTGTIVSPHVLGVAVVLYMSNYCLAPIIYIVRIPEVKLELKRIFLKCGSFVMNSLGCSRLFGVETV
jgi:hypothetical protein